MSFRRLLFPVVGSVVVALGSSLAQNCLRLPKWCSGGEVIGPRLLPVWDLRRPTSVAPNAGQDKAGRSDCPHFAIRAALGENAENADLLAFHMKNLVDVSDFFFCSGRGKGESEAPGRGRDQFLN